MTKKQFLKELKKKLNKLSYKEQKESLTFYSEMIEDRIEEGLTEEQAVNEIGSIEEIVKQINEENLLTKKKEKKTLTTWEKTLLIIGSPLWFPLLLLFFAILFTIYAVIWSVNIIFWAIGLPFYYIGKFVLIGSKKISEFSLEFTKNSLQSIINYIKRG